MPATSPPGSEPLRALAQRTVLVVALAIAGILAGAVVWLGSEVILLTFLALLLAVFLDALVRGIRRLVPVPHGLGLLLVTTLLLGFVAIGVWLFGPRLAEQVDELGNRLPQAIEQLRRLQQRIGIRGDPIAALQGEDALAQVGAALAAVLGGTARWLYYGVTVLFVGLFVAINPALYQRGLMVLMPLSWRPRGGEVLGELGRVLRWWLIGRAAAMFLVGLTTAIALLILGIPLAILLGVIVALLTFVPYLGPLLGAVPIAMLALAKGPEALVWAMAAYAVIQWSEGYIMDPLIMQKVVKLPPALTLFSQVLLGTLFGALGVIVATPLAALLMRATQLLYVHDVLGDRQDAPRTADR